jgi:hypothetical protein
LGLHTDQASDDLMVVVTRCFYRRVYGTFLDCLIRRAQKLKKLMDNQSARASDECQEEGKKHTHGETLRGRFGCAKARKAFRGLNKIGKNKRKSEINTGYMLCSITRQFIHPTYHFTSISKPCV